MRRFEKPQLSATSNILFKRCEGLNEFPRRSPSKKSFLFSETPRKPSANRSIFDDESPPVMNRTNKARKHKFAPISETENLSDKGRCSDAIDHLLHGTTARAKDVSKLQDIPPSKTVHQAEPAHENSLSQMDEQIDVLTFNDEASPAATTVPDGTADADKSQQGSVCAGTDGETSLDFFLDDSNTILSSSSASTAPAGSTQDDDSVHVDRVLQPKSQEQVNQNLSRPARPAQVSTVDLTDALGMLDLDTDRRGEQENILFSTPPTTPGKQAKPNRLLSPSKRAALIPKTPHRPSMDAFWDQEDVNTWNEKHSPRKLILPPVLKSPAKQPQSPRKQERRDFELKRHALADEFLRELDQSVTQGQIGQLANSTGGVRVTWSRTLNTTAGRANWRREKIRSHNDGAGEAECKYYHHASIELAEKVINDEDKLLNTLAHEFCHLANFMITGMTSNPHGKEFKAWASKCSQAFGARGVNVTTKHSYEIDFKYVWECTACGIEVKRHSKSVDPKKHRCGSCKSTLKQTKPTPRGSGKPSEYQLFVKEQMKVVKDENPGIAQKDVMKAVAAKWAKRGEGRSADKVDAEVEVLGARILDLTV
ncbi:HMG box-containing protein [Emericellopsis cladophorae]|uniref:HMG box-containing protein n=1 Tax=Emericellopsis cladophorae TaxID=2686198 RepID=A0A9P9XXC8_9HYPO|nr:HMG box-containing protein [Emericellopsis cladophorae]KAI6779455.1 HMG box-containing protein [Emericellopsis cladophorae]